jgi:hypothetical protein
MRRIDESRMAPPTGRGEKATEISPTIPSGIQKRPQDRSTDIPATATQDRLRNSTDEQSDALVGSGTQPSIGPRGVYLQDPDRELFTVTRGP